MLSGLLLPSQLKALPICLQCEILEPLHVAFGSSSKRPPRRLRAPWSAPLPIADARRCRAPSRPVPTSRDIFTKIFLSAQHRQTGDKQRGSHCASHIMTCMEYRAGTAHRRHPQRPQHRDRRSRSCDSSRLHPGTEFYSHQRANLRRRKARIRDAT